MPGTFWPFEVEHVRAINDALYVFQPECVVLFPLAWPRPRHARDRLIIDRRQVDPGMPRLDSRLEALNLTFASWHHVVTPEPHNYRDPLAVPKATRARVRRVFAVSAPDKRLTPRDHEQIRRKIGRYVDEWHVWERNKTFRKVNGSP